MSERLPWFRCFPSVLLGELAGLGPDEGYLYMTVLLLAYEADGTITETPRALSLRTGLSERKVTTTLGYLMSSGMIRRDEDDLLHATGFDPDLRREEWQGVRRPLSPMLRNAVYARDGFVCTYCGTGDGPFEIDHIHPVSRGGLDTIDNLCVACRDCNRSKWAMPLKEWRQ